MPYVVHLRRAQLGTSDASSLDVTQKSAGPVGRPFAPPWRLVMRHKDRQISDAGYAHEYLRQLEALDRSVLEALWLEGTRWGGVLTLGCYCRDGVFCHTYLLMDWLVRTDPVCWALQEPVPEWFTLGWLLGQEHVPTPAGPRA